MSEVISSRLNKENPQERQALGILKTWYSTGYSSRYVITEALLELNKTDPEQVATALDELKTTLDQVNHLLEQLGKGDRTQVFQYENRHENSILTTNFIESIKKSAKSGMQHS